MMTDQSEEKEILLYGTNWCPGVWATRRIFDRHDVPYRWIDIDKDEEASAYVERVNDGYRSVPTIVFPDGSILVEPSRSELAKKLDI
jgi:mycoredoxin